MTGWSTSTAARTITAASTAATARSGTATCAPTTCIARPASAAARRCGSIWSARSSSTRSTTNSGASARRTGGSTRSRCRCSRSATGARWACTCAATSSATKGVKAPKKLVVTGANNFEAHKMFDQIEFHEKELLPFYDLHLKGKNNGFMESAPVRLFVRGANVWRAEEEWPLAARDLRAVLSAQGPVGQRHLDERRRAVGRAAGRRRRRHQLHLSGLGVGQRRGRHRAGRPGRSGAARADLHVRAAGGRHRGHRADRAQAVRVVDQIDTQFIVKLTDQHPQDEAARAKGDAAGLHPGLEGLAQGLASREGREALDRARPFYTHTNPQPLTPGEIYEFDIEVLPISYVFKKGHRIRLEIANGDSPRDRRGVLASLSSDADGHRHDPSRRGACVVHPAAGGRQRVVDIYQAISRSIERLLFANLFAAHVTKPQP